MSTVRGVIINHGRWDNVVHEDADRWDEVEAKINSNVKVQLTLTSLVSLLSYR